MNNPHSKKKSQSGMVLIIVLISVAMMTMAAMSLVRSIDTGALIIGNLGFRQGATLAADSSVESAISWLQANNLGTTLYNDIPNSAYYSTSFDALDISGNSTATTRVLADWDNNLCNYAATGSFASCKAASPAVTANGYTTSYIIMRMCKTAGDPNLTTNNCAKPLASSSSTSPKRGELKYGEDKRFAPASGPYFRVVVRSRGPRNTTSYTETYLHF